MATKKSRTDMISAPALTPGLGQLVSNTRSLELKKHVGTVHVGGDLGLLDRKLVNVLMLNAYDTLLSQQKHRIHVTVLAEMLGFDSKNTTALKKSLKKIVTTPVEFDLLHGTSNTPWGVTTMMSAADIREGYCTYEYSSSLAEKLANPDVYLLVNVGVQKQFKGKHALALYENCLRFKKTGSTGWIPVEIWRRLLNADSSMYDEFKYFNRAVIMKSVAEVSEVSNIVVEPEYEREHRRVTKIRFSVREKPGSESANGDADERDRLRETAEYRRLRDIGISERLALSWLQADLTKVARVLRVVEKGVKSRRTRNPAGLMRSLFEGDDDVEDVQVDPLPKEVPDAPTASSQEREEDGADVHFFGIDELERMVASFASEGGDVSSFSQGKFKVIREKLAFGQWLIERHGIRRWTAPEAS